MIDVQSRKDIRNIPLKKVGVKNLSYPITVLDKINRIQHTTAKVNLYADLPHHFKGTHMSRFIEVFNQHYRDISMPSFLNMMEDIRRSLDAEIAFGEIFFPYFVEKHAPVSGQTSMMQYSCQFIGEAGRDRREFLVGIEVPVTTVCPCSKEISLRGAHNQRSVVKVLLELGPFFWIEDIITLVEESSSCDIYTLLKREDEKFITEKGYDNPRFVEDVVREVYLRLQERGDFPWFSVEAENFESIHNHSAFAYVETAERKVP